jgi:hypothetical protein
VFPKLVTPFTVKLPVITAFPIAVILFPINSLPLTVKLPVLVKDNKVVDPDTTWKEVAPMFTEAETDPVAVCDKFKPTIEEAGKLVNPEPFPWNEPLNDPDPIPTKDPVKDPVVLLIPVADP